MNKKYKEFLYSIKHIEIVLIPYTNDWYANGK